MRVLAAVALAPRGALNRAGVANDAGPRLDVRFERVVFTLRRLLLIPLFRSASCSRCGGCS
jgi:hypothetical protein